MFPKTQQKRDITQAGRRKFPRRAQINNKKKIVVHVQCNYLTRWNSHITWQFDSLINKWSHIILWKPHLYGIWWLIRSLDQSRFRISIITPTNYLANKNYQSLLMQNRKDLSKRCNLPLQKMMRKSAHRLHFAIDFSDKRLSMHSTSFGKTCL